MRLFSSAITQFYGLVLPYYLVSNIFSRTFIDFQIEIFLDAFFKIENLVSGILASD